MWSRRASISKSISVQLLEPVIFIGSNLDTSPVIRGTVDISFVKSCILQKLNLDFEGIIKTKWNESSKARENEKIIASNHLQLYPVTSATEPVVPLLLSPGSTRFSFEMPLPAGIPETISCPQITVDYNITVCMDYKKTTQSAGVLHEEIKKRVILARLPDNGMLTGENYPITIDSHKHFSNYCQYRITVDKKSAALGSALPVKIEIAPTVKDLRIKQIFLQLVEKRTVSPEEGEEQTSQSVHFLYPAKGSSIALPTRPLYTNWTGNFLYQIPDEKAISHSTQSYSQFHIRHILLVSLLVTFPETHGQHYGRHVTRTISFQTQFDLLDSHLSSEREYTKLPSYNCPVSIEEIEKLYQHGLGMDNPPSYEESLPAIL